MNISMKRFLTVVFVIMASLLFAVGCNGDKDYSLNYSATEMQLNETIQLEILPEPDLETEWKSLNPDVVTVDKSGKITAVNYGDAVISVSFGDVLLQCDVVVPYKNTEAAMLVLNLRIPTGTGNSLSMFKDGEYTVNTELIVGQNKIEIDYASVQYTVSDGSIIELIKNGNEVILKGKNSGSTELYATYEYNGTTLFTDAYTITVDVDKTVYTNANSVSLLLNKTPSGKTIEVGLTVHPDIFMSSVMLEQNDVLLPDEEIEWQTKDNSVVKVENNKIVSVSSGDTIITAVTEYGNVDIPVRVSYAITSAEDLDFLATVSYKESVSSAKKWLGSNFVFVNDIDYAEHTRNYILPIASMSVGYNATAQEKDGGWDPYLYYGNSTATVSYYSASWKNILGLSEGGDDTTGRYLSNADGSKFVGINPNGLWFSGRIDGNGYAIKNAWYMWDNYLGYNKGDVNKLYAIAGSFVGLNKGVIENLEFNVKTPNNFVIEKKGKYTQGNRNDNDTNRTTLTLTYAHKKILCADGNSVVEGFDYYNWANIVSSTESALVMINMNTISNVSYNVTASAGNGSGRRSATPGVFVLVNMATIKDCIVHRNINRIQFMKDGSEQSSWASFNSALMGINLSNGYNSQCPNGEYIDAKDIGGNVQGCYVLISSATGKNLTTETFEMFYCKNSLDWASTDTISKKLYVKMQEVSDGEYNSQLVADYASMVADVKNNNNLSTDIWVIDSVNNTVSLKKGIVDFSV